LILVATDSYRLAEKKVQIKQGDGEFKIIVPGRTTSEMMRILSLVDFENNEKNVRFLISENQIALHFGNTQLISRLVEGNYPDYAQIIPKDFKTTATLNTEKLIKETKTASLFTTTGVNAINCEVDNQQGVIKLSSVSSQTGEYHSEIPADISGESNKTTLNHRYVLDGLNNIKSESLELRIINADSPCLIVPKNDKTFLYIVMPIRQ